MRILFDQGTPVPLRGFLHPHPVDTAAELGWSTLTNGNLIAAAEREGFDVIITTDQNLKYQQNLAERSIAVVVLKTTSWPRIRNSALRVLVAVQSLPPSGYIEIEFH